jgi:hypothetical protein
MCCVMQLLFFMSLCNITVRNELCNSVAYFIIFKSYMMIHHVYMHVLMVL